MVEIDIINQEESGLDRLSLRCQREAKHDAKREWEILIWLGNFICNGFL